MNEIIPSVAISKLQTKKKKRGRPTKEARGFGFPELEAFKGWPDEQGRKHKLEALGRYLNLRERVDRVKNAQALDYDRAQTNRQGADVLLGASHVGPNLDFAQDLADAERALGFGLLRYVEDCLISRLSLEQIGRRICDGRGNKELWEHCAKSHIGTAAKELAAFFGTPREARRKLFFSRGK